MKTYLNRMKQSLAAMALTALAVGSFGSLLSQSPTVAYAAEGTAKVTINKYIDNAPATSITASSSDFQMVANYTISSTTGSGNYALSASGYNGDPTPYQAMTSDLPIGSDYSTNEIIDGTIVGATDSSSTPFSLVGYTTGETLVEASAGTPTMTTPSFTNLTTDKYVIVWNKSYVAPITPTSTATTTVKVTIKKFIDNEQATASSSGNADFPMTATYNSIETGPGTGTYNLSASGYNGDPTPYQAMTSDMTSGADYSTSEIMGGTVVNSTCSTTQPFALTGYTTGDTLAEAMNATTTMATPTFVGMTNDKFVIVWNRTCSTGGTIGGEVTGTSTGSLAVNSITPVKTTATADGTFENGWKYLFNITVPTNETNLSMKFANWMSTVGSNIIAVAGNMRISSAQANNSGATVTVTAADTYTTPPLTMTGDLNASTTDKQVQVLVEVAIPTNTANGSYTTSYGVKTQ